MGHFKTEFFFSLRAEMMKVLPNVFCPSPPVMHFSVRAHISSLLLIHTDYVFISADDSTLSLKECCFWCVLKDFGEYQESYYSVQTTEGEQISQLIAGYIDIILKKVSATENRSWVNVSFIQISVPNNICCDVSPAYRNRVRIVLALRGMKNPPCWKNLFLLRSKSCLCPVCRKNKKRWPRSFRSTVWWFFKHLEP